MAYGNTGGTITTDGDYKTQKLLQFNDNIYAFKFEGLGKLSLNVQGLRV